MPGAAAPEHEVLLGPEDEIRVILEQVQEMGAGDATEPSPMLDALLSMAECGPDICEAFFTPLPALRTTSDGGQEAPRQMFGRFHFLGG